MSYLTWRKKNEDRVLGFIANGNLEALPAWRHQNAPMAGVLGEMTLRPIVNSMMMKEEMIPIQFELTFMEYLYETYNISPVDVELFTKMTTTSQIAFIDSIIDETREDSLKYILNLVRSMMSPNAQKELDVIVNKLAEQGSGSHGEEKSS